ncbi:MAG: ABC transporter permease [Planctomycetes bacterium]|nr:ABC transporter permease [Planctomycetota bacterium]MCW8136377.1 ABC transporter permease [Planctomycetota bacterium]
MPALDRKLLRDLWRMKGQALAIAAVIAAGVAMYVSQLGMLDSLRLTQHEYYSQYRFAHVFAGCKRAPESVMEDIRGIDGVQTAESRVVWGVTLDVPGLDEPAVGQLISYPDHGEPLLNDLFIRTGDLPQGPDQIAASEAFCKAHKFKPGDSVVALINGRKRRLTITAIVLSPEYVYSLPAGGFIPDDKRYGVFWMRRHELAGASDMQGAFNDVTLTLKPGASEPEVMRRLDDVLAPYGGRGAMPQRLQLSNWFLNNEITQLEQFGNVLPVIFLAVAAFLLNVVMSRLIATQREQVAALKAFGYRDRDVAIHYAKFVLLVSIIGGIIGAAAGAWMGRGLTQIYTEFYHFPVLVFRLDPLLPVRALAITAGASLLGAMASVRKAAALPPAEAMRPEAPPTYRRTLVERIGLEHVLRQPTRMILRELERRPVKAALSVLGISMAGALLVVGFGFIDMVNYVIDSQANVLQREDVSVTFIEPRNRSALHDLRAMPGVQHAEPFRNVPARLRFKHRWRLAGINGVSRNATLNRVVDEDLKPLVLPDEGVALSRALADVLGITGGDMLTLEVLEGERPTRQVRVAALVDDFLGLNAYMDLEALNRLMRQDGVISGAHISVDPAAQRQLYRQLKDTPFVAGVSLKQAAIDNLRKTMAENILITLGMTVFFAGVITFGVVYNAARISLSERSRELASLRVLGMTRGEISYILLGELAILVLAAVPLGCLLGYWMARGTLAALNTETFRLPFVMSDMSYSVAATVVLVAGAISALIVRRRLDRLDLVEVLKTKE